MWGKSGLKIECLDCDQAFDEEKPEPETDSETETETRSSDDMQAEAQG